MSTNPNHRRGFTLIELIISVGLFSIVATIAATAYLKLVDIDRRTRATSDLVNNMTFVINSMANNIRTGNTYRCSPPGDQFNNGLGCATLIFNDSASCATTYSLSGTSIQETQTGGSQCTNTGVLTDPAIKITDLKFIVRGNGHQASGHYLEPHVIILITGSIDIGTNETSTFTIQTSATQRGIDLPSS